MEPYDVIVIGTGAGGSGVAIRCAKDGWNVAVVDDEPYGGTCMLRGCDPKKVFVSASELVDWHRRMTGQGVSGEAQLNWPALMRFKRTFTDPVPSRQETTYRELGIATYHGVGHFTGPDRFVVEGKELESRFFVIASGARPAPLGIPGEEHVKTSTDFLELDLARADVRTDARGAVEVNDWLQSVTNPRIYATGDAVASPGALPLTPVAGHQSIVVASNLLHGNHKIPDYRGVSSVVFTTPPLAAVGLAEEEAKRNGLKVRVKSEDTRNWLSNRRVLESAAMYQTITEEGTNRILGAHLLGPHAEEVINLFAIAIRNNLSASDLSHMIYAYPTSASDIAYMV